jgi:hypothetical protein
MLGTRDNLPRLCVAGTMKIAFEQRCVAFLDVLGFKALVLAAATDRTKLAELNRLVSLLESVIPTLDAGVHETVPSPRANSEIPIYLRLPRLERAFFSGNV